MRPRLATIVPQKLQQIGRQHDHAVLASLTFIDMDKHPTAVDVADLERADFRGWVRNCMHFFISARPQVVPNGNRKAMIRAL